MFSLNQQQIRDHSVSLQNEDRIKCFRVNSVQVHSLTKEIIHHLRCVMRSRGNTQQLFSTGNCGVVYCLDIDAVLTHQSVTDLSIFSSICNLDLQNGQVQGNWNSACVMIRKQNNLLGLKNQLKTTICGRFQFKYRLTTKIRIQSFCPPCAYRTERGIEENLKPPPTILRRVLPMYNSFSMHFCTPEDI